jgi:HEAT repeat protein
MKTTNRICGALIALAVMAPAAQAQHSTEREVAVHARQALAHAVQARAQEAEAAMAWLQEDPGAGEYRSAREALNARRYMEAAERFARMRESFPESGYVPDSYYYQAFAMYREQSRESFRAAMALLERQRELHPRASTRADADELRVRIEAALAQRGDAGAAAAIAEQAAQPCGEEQEVRLAALSALLNMNAERAVPILQEVLRNRDSCSVELRRRAVFLISQHMTDESVDILVDLAHTNPDPDPEVREQAVFWLSQVQSEAALDALLGILGETNDEALQERAIFAISQHGGERAIGVLRQFAERPDAPSHLRENAIFWIGQGGPEGAQFLQQLYASLEDPELKERTVFGIAQSGTAEARAWLMERAMDSEESLEVRKNALFWAGQTGGIQSSELEELYGSVTDMEMKEQVIFVASQAEGSAAVDFLMDVARDEQDAELRQRAIFWLGQSDDERVAEFLLSLIGA